MRSKILITLVLIVLFSFSSTVSQTKDNWRSVRTNHLFVIGNADAEQLRQVAAWLEFFHSAFARLVSRNVIDSSVPTTVVIFRDDASFTPFKPLYRGRPANIAGFFLPGNDVNYIALSLDSNNRDPYRTAFHEYVHLHIRDNVPGAPLWLNEGLAEFYGALQFSGNEALIGAPIYGYINLLRQSELLPLDTLFSIGFNSPHYNEQDKTGIFYGESWALVHYLMLSDGGRQEQFKRFLQLVSRGDNAAKAIESAFGVTIPALEEDLRAYVRHGNLTAQHIAGTNAQAYTTYTAMQRSSLTEDEKNSYLGDLLLHQGRYAEAKSYLPNAAQPPREPPKTVKQTGASRMIVAETGSVAVNDGQTIDNSGSLPTADELLRKYIEVAGGNAAINGVRSRVVKGTMDVVGVSRGETFEQSYADFYSVLNLKKNYAKLTLQGKSKIGYRDVYVIDMQSGSGAADRLYMDAESYLPVRMNTTRIHQGASVPVEIYFDDWREVDGLKVPYSITQSFPKMTMTLTVKEIRNNVPVDGKIFERPF